MNRIRGLGTLIVLLVILIGFFFMNPPGIGAPEEGVEPSPVISTDPAQIPQEPDTPSESAEQSEHELIAQARLAEITDVSQAAVSTPEPEPGERYLYQVRASDIQTRKDARLSAMIERNATPTPAPKPSLRSAPTPAPPPPAPTPEPSQETETFTLARMIHGESHWETYDGKIAVGQCAYDRWKNTAPFPGQPGSWNPGGVKSIKDILTSPSQFVLSESHKVCDNCIKAATDVMSGFKAFPNHYITNFRPVSADITEAWRDVPYIGHIGGHAFYGYAR